MEPPAAPAKLVVLISGSGRTLANLLAAIERGDLHAEIGLVISSAPAVRGIEVAAAAGVPTRIMRRREFASDSAYSDAIFTLLEPLEPDLLILAGFLRRLVVPSAWEGRILNIHPALLPEMAFASGQGMYGERVHAAVLASGATRSGATVHIVDNEYDTGPVIGRIEVPVETGDTAESLAARVFAAECRLYPEAIAGYLARLRATTTEERQ